MKKSIFFGIIAALLVLAGCENNDYEAPDTLSDISWYTSIFPGKPYAVNQGEYISFMDISVGALSHEWVIEEGAYFLSPTFKANDSLPLFIMPDAGLTSTEKTVHVLFTKPGVSKVRLHNTFPEKVTYNASVPYSAVQQGDVWVVDTTFSVDVYEPIKPAFDIYQDEAKVLSVGADDEPNIEDQATWDTIYVEAGASLKFVDMTTVGRPNQRLWTAVGGAFQGDRSDSAVVVKFFKLGTFTASFKSSRGGELPVASAEKPIPAIIKVIPSTQPFEFNGGLQELADQTIRFKVTGEVAPFTGKEDNFTVHVVNEASGFDQDIPVSLAKVSDTDATMIELKLAEPIYNSDVVTVSYSGDIKSTDTRTLQPFGPETVQMYFEPNLLDAAWAGFDVASDKQRAAFADGFWVGAKNEPTAVYARVEGADSPSGDPVMSYTMTGGISADIVLQGSKFKNMLPDQGIYDYLISMKIYIEPGSNLSKILTLVQDPFTVISWDLTNVPEGQWVTLKQAVSFPSLPTKRYDMKVSAADNPGAGDVKFYFDDYSFQPYEKRP